MLTESVANVHTKNDGGSTVKFKFLGSSSQNQSMKLNPGWLYINTHAGMKVQMWMNLCSFPDNIKKNGLTL